MTGTETAVLNEIQTAFPVCHDPYAEIAARTGLARDTVLDTVRRLRQAGVIRRMGAVFDGKRLGYHGCLVACRVSPEALETAAACAGRHPEVTHNYQRNHDYNLWFTVVAETPARRDEILAGVRACEGVSDVHPLPALKTFKIKVDFRFGKA